ncbi:MAG: DUF350 domain-containing protein [Bacteroidota bacterium]
MTIEFVLIHAGYLSLYVLIFFLSKWIKGWFSSYNLDEQLTHFDNNAVSVSIAGYFIGVTAVFVGAYTGPSSNNLAMDFLGVAGYSLAGVLLLNLTRIINERFILHKFSVQKEIIHDQNPGTGVVEGASYVATALIIAGSVNGQYLSESVLINQAFSGFLSTIVFYLIGIVCLIGFARIYNWLSPFDLHAEIEKDNIAAGLGFSGAIISIGIIIMRAVKGDLTDWGTDLMTLGLDILIVFIYLIVVRFVFDKFILRNSDLNTEISRDQNIGAGLLEMMIAICFSAVLFFVL